MSRQENGFEYLYSQHGLPDNRVYTLYTDSKDRTWIGMRDGLSYMVNGSLVNLDEDDSGCFEDSIDSVPTVDVSLITQTSSMSNMPGKLPLAALACLVSALVCSALFCCTISTLILSQAPSISKS